VLLAEKTDEENVMFPAPAALAAASASRSEQFELALPAGQLEAVPLASSAVVVTTNEAGALTVSVKVWVAFGVVALTAVMRSE
jgi:hypothetical protein